jgi:hypothetical protein
MSNYTKATNFAAKDSLPSGNAGKIIKGTEIDTEFNAIASAISSKADTDSPTLTGTPLAPTAAGGTNTTQIATTAFVQSEISSDITTERSATATLTNKTINGSNNTLSNVSLTTAVTGTLPVANGGTGATSLTSNNVIIGNGTSAVQFVAPGTSGNVLTSNGTSWASTAIPAQLTRQTAVDTTSGTSIDFTGIPSTAKRIAIVLNQVSTSGSSNIIIQIGDSGGIETSDYSTMTTWCVFNTNLQSTASITNGWAVAIQNASSYQTSGILTLYNISGNIWVGNGIASAGSTANNMFSGTKTLSATLTQLRLTTANGTDTFDSGSATVLYD